MRGYYLAIAAAFFLVVKPVVAQSGYVIKERKIQPGDMIEAGNASGWLVTYSWGGGADTRTLHDPSGVSRDISALAPPTQNGNGAGVSAIDEQGSVFFAQTLGALKNKDAPSEFIAQGHVISKLSLGATSTTPVFSSSFPQGGDGTISVNSKGQIVEAQYKRGSGDGKITLRKIQDSGIQNSGALTQLVTLPSKKIGSQDGIRLDLDSSGYFAIVRTVDNPQKFAKRRGYVAARVIKDLCVGNISSTDYACASKAKIRQLSANGFQFDAMAGGGVAVTQVGQRTSRYTLLSTDTFKPLSVIAASRSNFYQEIGLSSESGSKILAMGVSNASGNDGTKFLAVDRLHIWQRDGAKKVLSCKLDTAADVNLEEPSRLLQGDRLLVPAKRGADQLLLDFIPTASAQGATGIVGRCD